MSKYANEIEKRRTFAIISHPDAGKTTLTEKFLLYGGAINLAGSVKGKATARHAVSDWMEIEKERGISVTSSVLQFHYDGYCINILDTPGHQDFSEDTYRTLMAADSAVMVIDGSKGVEAQTRKLFKVCVMRHIPIFTFINKMDRDANDTFDLLDEIEKELGIATCPINWPIGSGKKFRGVYDRNTHKVLTFSDTQKGTKEGVIEEIDIDDARLDDIVDPDQKEQLMDEIELLDGASVEFDQEQVSKGNMTPVFFGSALTNFGVETFLEHFLKMTTSPLPRVSDEGEIDPMSDDFSAFVFKIQANMNKAHRDRIAFMRICSGKFDASQEVYHVQGDKKMRLLQPQQMMAESRHVVDEAYAGDIIGVFDPGIFSIGDTICSPDNPVPIEFQKISEPTIAMQFVVNDSPFAGQEGKFVTSRHLRDRLFRELNTDVSLRVEETDNTDSFKVSGRGELHLSVLVENMRREGYEFAVSKAEVLYKKDENGKQLEPMETVYIDVPDEFTGTVIDKLSQRKGELRNMGMSNGGYTRLEFSIPSRGLIGYRGEFLTDTKGNGIMNTAFDCYAPYKGDIQYRSQGSLIAFETGEAVAYGLFNAQDRGTLFIGPGEKVYSGMVIGQNAKTDDIELNVCKTKHLTNTRSSSADEALKLTPPRILSLEEALDFIDTDELLEVTPKSLRIRKKILDPKLRKRSNFQ